MGSWLRLGSLEQWDVRYLIFNLLPALHGLLHKQLGAEGKRSLAQRLETAGYSRIQVNLASGTPKVSRVRHRGGEG